MLRRGMLVTCLPLYLATLGCATDNLAYQWRPEAHAEKSFASILVVAVAGDAETRKVLEDTLAVAITDARTRALASHRLQGGSGLPDGDGLVRMVRQQDPEAVAIIQPVATAEYQAFAQANRPGAGSLQQDYLAALEYLGKQGSAAGAPGHFLSVGLYEASGGRELWMANSRTRGHQGQEEFMRAAARLFAESLEDYGLIH